MDQFRAEGGDLSAGMVSTAGTDNPAEDDAGSAGGELLVVDPGIDLPNVLINGCRPGVHVHCLARGGRGLEQTAGFLAGRRAISTLHLLCRGEPGALVLTGERLDLPALVMRRGVLAEMSQAFRPGAMLVLYGGSVACGPEGLRFLDYLESALGLMSAASATPVGAAALGGRWTLRDRFGTPVRTAFSPLSRATYPALLSCAR